MSDAARPSEEALPLLRRFFTPVDIASLAVFRLFLGAICLYGSIAYGATGALHNLWLRQDFFFKYYGFEWVVAVPDSLMRVLWAGLCIASAGIFLGLLYRASVVYFFVVFGYFFLVDQANFLNQYYLLLVVAGLMVFIPAHGALSIDACFRPRLRRATVPAWTVAVLCFSMACVYFFGGVAKVNPDWLRGEPLHSWLLGKTGAEFFGAGLGTKGMALFFSWAGLLFDLLIVPFLLWKKTRWIAFGFALVFHVSNTFLFGIGIFPALSVALTALFLPPDWPRRLAGPLFPGAESEAPPVRHPGPTAALLAAFVAVQVALPLRPLFYPGNPAWTDDGHRFAWRMKLRWKTGTTRFFVRENGEGEREKVYPDKFITDHQEIMMLGRPDMILQLAHHIGSRRLEAGAASVEVFARSKIALNGRKRRDFIDRNADLMKVKRSLGPTRWILPLED